MCSHSRLPFSISLITDKVLEVGEPVHVEALVLVERHALNEGAEVLVDTEAFEVLGQSRLDSLVKCREVGTGILLDLALKAVEFLHLTDVVADLNAVVVDLGIDSGALNDEAFAITAISDEDGEVAVVLGFWAALLIFTLVLFIRKLLIVRDRLPVNTHKISTGASNKISHFSHEKDGRTDF